MHVHLLHVDLHISLNACLHIYLSSLYVCVCVYCCQLSVRMGTRQEGKPDLHLANVQYTFFGETKNSTQRRYNATILLRGKGNRDFLCSVLPERETHLRSFITLAPTREEEEDKICF